ncbi:MAG TPA: ABC transporter permease [bacterium]|jgi:ABC-2 type transport system permease protein|nr:ABC transporter permease [bacterium]
MNPILIGFIKKEFVQTLRDPRMRFLLLVAPMVQLILFGFALSTDVRNIKMSYVYKPNDVLMQKIQDRCLGSGWFIPAPREDNNPFHLIQSGKADAVLIAPEGGFTRAVEDGKGRVQLLVDAENIVKAQSIEGYVKSIVEEAIAEQTHLNPPALPIQFSVRYLYNPELETSVFMVPGVLCMVLVIITVVLTSSSIAREKELGTFEALIASPAKPIEILMGKTVPYVIFGMVDMFLVLIVAVLVFHVPMRGPIWMLFVGALGFVINTVCLGVFLSSFVKNMQQSSMFGFLFIFPAIQLSGLIYPIENMPWILKPIAYMDPVFYFVALLRNIMLKGGDMGLFLTYAGILYAMAIFMVWVSSKRFKQTLN